MIKNLLIAALFYVISAANTDDARCANIASETLSDCNKDAIITTLLNTAKNILEDAKCYAALKTSCSMPIDCAEILDSNPSAKSGIYRIWPRSRAIEGSIEVYCDMNDDEGGWTVIQRRGDFGSPQDYFYKDWDAYKIGFGDLQKDFWLGNNRIFTLTNQRVNIVKFVLSDWEGNTTYATYNDFWIDNESQNYTLHARGYNGTAGKSFSYQNGSQFSTKDRDNGDSNINCANLYSGAWWFKSPWCHHSHLNGLYLRGADKVNYKKGLHWAKFRGAYYSLKDTVIKIRPRDYRRKILDVTPY